jgi:hypothetical protein
MQNLIRFAIATLALTPVAGIAQTLAPSQDAYYVPNNGSNFGTATTVTVGSSSSIGLVQFDLSQLPAGVTAAQIQKATLTLFLDHVNVGGSINVDAVSASTPWGELTVSGNSGISPGIAVNTSVMTNTVDTFVAMDATASVQGWIATPGSNNGFMIQANTGTSVQFDSKENTSTSHPAMLTIVLASSGPTGATGPTGAASMVAGPTGLTGAASMVAGPAGPTGAIGATGGTVSGYGYFYNILSQFVAPQNDMTFDSIGAASGILLMYSGTSQITVTATGVYSVVFVVSSNAYESSQFALTDNGVVLPGTTYGSEADLAGIGTTQYTGQVIVPLSAGDIITLRNPALFTDNVPLMYGGATQPQLSISASILFVRLQ